MIRFKTKDEIKLMRESGRLTAMVFAHLKQYIEPGITTRELDRIAESFIRKNGAVPSFKGYRGYRHTLCTSVNNQVVHGIPSKYKLKKGDIISIDVGVFKNGFHGDATRTFVVGGKTSKEALRLVRTVYKSMLLGIEQAKPGKKLGDIGYAIQSYAESMGYSVVREYIGHGVGRQLHEDPEVLHYGRAGTGITLEPGMVITIEPILNQGARFCRTLKDGWTVVTADKKLSAQFENTIAILEDGNEVLTKLEDNSDIPECVRDVTLDTEIK